jgi:hypothetical protein
MSENTTLTAELAEKDGFRVLGGFGLDQHPTRSVARTSVYNAQLESL